MVSTVSEPVEPVEAIEALDSPHRHRPFTYSDSYTELGRVWVVPYCECGLPLSPRLASSVRKASA
jgi:hypothetical protein